MYQAYPIALQRAPERFDFFQALVGELFYPMQIEPCVPSPEEFTGRVETARLGELRLAKSRLRRARSKALAAVAQQLQAGTVYINKHAEVAPNVPFGGIKGSGLGVEFGQEGLEAYTTIKIIKAAA